MEYTIGAGVVVHTGASMIEYNGTYVRTHVWALKIRFAPSDFDV